MTESAKYESERTHLYLATGLTPGPQRLEADESIEAHVVPLEQALAWAFDGTIRDAKTIVALSWWQHRRSAPITIPTPQGG